MKPLDLVAARPLAERNRRRAPASTLAVKKSFPFLARIILIPMAATGFLWLTSANEVTLYQGVSAFTLLCISWGGYCKWKQKRQDSVPLFPMISFMFWLYYAFPLFWGDRAAVSSWAMGETLSEDAITGAIMMALVGVVAIWLGIKSGIGKRWSPKLIPDIPNNSVRWDYLRGVMIISSLISFFDIPFAYLGEGMAQIIFILQSIVPMVAFAILFRHYLRGEATQFDKILLLLFLAIRVVVGMSSIWLGAMVYVMLTCAVIYIAEKKRIPRFVVVLLVLYVLFFQVGKFSVRQKYWYEQEESSKIERIGYWMNESVNKWGEALSDPSSETLRTVLYQSLSRVSLLTQTANVLELTPGVVPYQYGRLYSYMAIALIPRFVWPDKPSVNEANQFYQVAYGITAEEDLSQGSFAVGFMTEGYISFGWYGVLGIMFLIGIFLDFFQKTFLAEASGLLLRGIGVVLLPYFLSIEFQLSAYLGGTVQRVLLCILVLLPIIRFKKVSRQQVSVERGNEFRVPV